MAKPTTEPRWIATGKIATPATPKQNAGFDVGERPPAQYFNWFFNLVYQWITYLASRFTASRWIDVPLPMLDITEATYTIDSPNSSRMIITALADNPNPVSLEWPFQMPDGADFSIEGYSYVARISGSGTPNLDLVTSVGWRNADDSGTTAGIQSNNIASGTAATVEELFTAVAVPNTSGGFTFSLDAGTGLLNGQSLRISSFKVKVKNA